MSKTCDSICPDYDICPCAGENFYCKFLPIRDRKNRNISVEQVRDAIKKIKKLEPIYELVGMSQSMDDTIEYLERTIDPDLEEKEEILKTRKEESSSMKTGLEIMKEFYKKENPSEDFQTWINKIASNNCPKAFGLPNSEKFCGIYPFHTACWNEALAKKVEV